MKRRTFVKETCAACLSISALALLNSCSSLKNTTGTLVKDGIKLNIDEFKIKDKDSSAYRSFLVIRNDSLKFPICVYRLSNEQYSALWMQCSHQGAELQASGDYLQCPAHGSEFNNKGIPTNGPASNTLRTFRVSLDNNEIFIDLRKSS